jgi:TonB family protein
MKSCPRCGKSYPDTETFCENDGTVLTQGGTRETAVMAADQESAGQPTGVIECPVCGGKAEPGELICNFCGTRLAPDTDRAEGPSAGRSAANPETFVPVHNRIETRGAAAKTPIRTPESSGGRRLLGVVGYSLAAILALAAGAWLAIYLSAHPKPQVAEISPAASPSPAVPSGPSIQLATNIPLQVAGAAASATERNHSALTKVFEDNKAALFDAYRHALAGGSSAGDGMVVSVHIMPDGSVSGGSVRVSTTPNPSVDEEVVKAITAWKFSPTKAGDVDADYPMVFSANPGDAPGIESSLSARLTSLAAGEPPEYAYSPDSAASPTEAPASPPVAEGSTPPSVASASTPAGVPAEPEAPPAVVAVPAPPRTAHRTSRRRREELASLPGSARMPKPTLLDRVTGELHSSRKLRRVQAYTSGGTVTLYGKVFDDNDKLLADRTARSIGGVSNVVNNLTTDTQEWAQNQALITQGLQSAGFGDVTVKVIGHDAYLGGEVKTDLDRERAVTIAEGAAPVKVRTNLIRVAPGRVFGF